MHPDTGRGEDAGRIGSEEIRLASRVASDHDPALGGTAVGREKMSGEASSRLAHHQPVHSHGAGADRGAKSSGAELQAANEPLVEGWIPTFDQLIELVADVSVWFRLEPTTGRVNGVLRQLAHRSRVRSSTSGRGPT